ncbi:sensor histidine kinase [Kribbella sancticallisti]|uniref:histidine kinase n=1 Tax=Kribbella sancticallisti TaxID=460087 RepID=A0ABN2CGJ8_9ACTN
MRLADMRADALLAFVVGLPLAVLTAVVAVLSVPGARAFLLIAAALVAHVAFAFRRARPVTSHLVICAAFAAEAAVTGLFLVLPSVLVFPLSLFACTAYAPRRWLGLVTGGVGAGAVTARFATDESVQAASLGPNPWMLFALLMAVVAAAWSMGLFRRTQLAYVQVLQERAGQAAELAAQGERTRIAREMHDVVAHSLSVMVNQAKGGRYAPERAAETLEVIEDTGRQALTDMRGLLGVLRTGPAEQLPQPGLADLPDLLERLRRAGLALRVVEHGESRRLSPAAELTAYRVVQEALTNVVKHAGEAAVAVTLSWQQDALLVEVVDDGDGVDGTTAGHGLIGMRERVAAIGGGLSTGPGTAGGFVVRATIPVER